MERLLLRKTILRQLQLEEMISSLRLERREAQPPSRRIILRQLQLEEMISLLKSERRVERLLLRRIIPLRLLLLAEVTSWQRLERGAVLPPSRKIIPLLPLPLLLEEAIS